ncbi:MAG: hypothetical protein ACI4J4_01295 [Ruminiclostridium sp.]
MNLTKVEKIIIAVLVIGAILAAGIFFFIVPSYQKIEQANKRLNTLKTEQSQLNEKLAREKTIDDEINTAKKEAIELEGCFYPDLTTYEATEIAQAYLKECNLTTHAINVNALSTNVLELDYFQEVVVEYDLKNFSQSARGIDENALVEGEFMDGGKKYTVSYSSVSDIQIMDDAGNVIDKEKYTDYMTKVYKKTLCKAAVETATTQTVGAVAVSFEVDGLYKDYLKFLDFVNDLDRATFLNGAEIPMTVTIDEDKDSDKKYVDEAGQELTGKEANGGETRCENDTPIKELSVELVFLCVEPMDELETIDAAGTQVVVNQ